jgi:hypothetical protein
MLQPFQHTFLFSQRAMRALLLEHGYEPILIESTRKVITVDYLFGQLRQTNPMLSRGLHRAKRALPAALRYREVAVNIGEMFACGRKR